MRTSRLQARRAALKLPTDPPKKRTTPSKEPVNPQREYNLKRRAAEMEFAKWFLQQENRLPIGLEGELKLGEKKREAEFAYEVAKNNLARERELRERYEVQERSWLAAAGIAPSWTEQKKANE